MTDYLDLAQRALDRFKARQPTNDLCPIPPCEPSPESPVEGFESNGKPVVWKSLDNKHPVGNDGTDANLPPEITPISERLWSECRYPD
jgi:hypothetical protein